MNYWGNKSPLNCTHHVLLIIYPALNSRYLISVWCTWPNDFWPVQAPSTGGEIWPLHDRYWFWGKKMTDWCQLREAFFRDHVWWFRLSQESSWEKIEWISPRWIKLIRNQIMVKKLQMFTSTFCAQPQRGYSEILVGWKSDSIIIIQINAWL